MLFSSILGDKPVNFNSVVPSFKAKLLVRVICAPLRYTVTSFIAEGVFLSFAVIARGISHNK